MYTVDLVKAVINSQHGWAVADQFEATFNGEPFEEQNYNALKYIEESVYSILRSDLLNEEAEGELEYYLIRLKVYLAE